MKQVVLGLFVLVSGVAQAQTKSPTMAKLVQLYVDTNMAAINDYAHELGFTGEPFGYNAVGNTYDYMHYGFAEKDTLGNVQTSLNYTWGQHGIHIPYSLITISYGTNSAAEFDALINELITLGVIEEHKGDALPGEHFYYYKEMHIRAYLNALPNGPKYNISIGRRGW